MKKLVKIITVLVLTLMIFSNMVHVTAGPPSYSSQHSDGGEGGVSAGDIDTSIYRPSKLDEEDYKEAFSMATNIVSALQIIGIVIAIVGVMILGIKYMLGSVEQKAEYKKTMIPYIVGCVFIFAITTIVSILYKLGSQLNVE